MSFYDIYSKYKNLESGELFNSPSAADVERAIHGENLGVKEFISLLSYRARDFLEEMAERSRELTLQYFGKTIQLYTPLYLSDHCDNQCAYCGFNTQNKIKRRKLSLEEVEKEARLISATGLKHILVLTGESRTASPVAYIRDCAAVLKKYFSSISIEVYPLTEEEYAVLVSEGVDALTIYQETYDESVYKKVHGTGPKRDYRYRLDAPERGAKGGMRGVNIGALLGLGDWRKDIFLLALHARYLEDKFPGLEIGASVPRLRPIAKMGTDTYFYEEKNMENRYLSPFSVSDKDVAQIIMALRIFLPRIGISISTREDRFFRENLIGLGVTRMSAGSSTEVGARISKEDEYRGQPQFEISDRRNVDEIKVMLERKGYQPVFKDWAYF